MTTALIVLVWLAAAWLALAILGSIAAIYTAWKDSR